MTIGEVFHGIKIDAMILGGAGLAVMLFSKSDDGKKLGRALLVIGIVVVCAIWIFGQPNMDSDMNVEDIYASAKFAKSVAEDIVSFPATVSFNPFSWGFDQEGNTIKVSAEFSTKNALGLRITHEFYLVCEIIENHTKIRANEIYLNGNRVG